MKTPCRLLAFDVLEPRRLLNVDWRNPVDSLDVNANGSIAADDVLLIINRLNARHDSLLPASHDAASAYYDVDGDQQVTAADVLDVINAINAGTEAERVPLAGADGPRNQIAVTIGQPQGVRVYQLRISGSFAAGAAATDHLAIYLFDPTHPTQTLLDQGQPGSPLFELTPSGASYPADFVQWDGSILTIALPNFVGHDTGLLRLQSVSSANHPANQFVIVPLSNSVDAAATWPPFATQSLTLTAHLSPDSDPDGNGVVLTSTITVEGQTAAGADVQLSESGASALTTTADAQGHYQFSVDVAEGTHDFSVSAADTSGRQASVPLEVKHGDVILDWNASLLTVVRDWTTLSNDPYTNRVVTSPPPVVARNLAMVHAAMFDAVNAVEQLYPQYHANVTAPTGTSEVVAAAAAAQRVAATLYSKIDEQAIFTAALTEALNSVPDGPAKDQGLAVGQQVGDAIIAWRLGDGASTTVNYVPGTAPGQWQRTFPDYYPPLLPQWPSVTPFAMTSGSEFRPAPPPALDSAEYAAAVDQVQRLGGYTSTERTDDQTDIALFWADGGGTYTPPGHWNQIAADVALAQHTSLMQNARLFMMLDVALADAGIACWDAKYDYSFWRPIDAIRQADLDGNDATTPDTSWTPLIRTPNFPSYMSGHSTFSAAAATVLDDVFGTNVEFTSVSDDHTGFRERPLAPDQVLTRSFSSFDEAAAEAGLSRIYGGIHYSFDNTAGQEVGRSVGQLVVASFPFQP
ncbi:MAG TPA: dockerin type I domain-containing protein [Pirellulaceae bacterium]|jgi:hypothetical protein